LPFVVQLRVPPLPPLRLLWTLLKHGSCYLPVLTRPYTILPTITVSSVPFELSSGRRAFGLSSPAWGPGSYGLAWGVPCFWEYTKRPKRLWWITTLLP
ncbi:hypothetical protein IWQ62_006490, partial [Dispira parvispora]